MHDQKRVRRRGHSRRLALTLALAASYMLAEVIGGLLSNSLALLADAGHMFSDVAALALSLFATWIAERPAGGRQTYGFYRAEVLAALVNGATLLAIAGYIFYEGVARLVDPPAVAGGLMMGIAWGGLVVNLLGLWILSDGRGDNLNVRGAWLHVLTDTLGSAGAIVAGGLIWAWQWTWADPVASLAIGGLVVYSSWRLLVDSVAVLMESVPHGIDVDEIDRAIRAVPGVQAVHDLHIWSITSGVDALSAHVTSDETERPGELLRAVRDRLHQYGIDHVTIQLEPPGFDDGHAHH